jgi:autotransporter adhesin
VIGSGVTTTQDNSVVLGNASTDRPATTVTGTTIVGKNYTFAGAGSAANGVVSVGGAGTERQIINVAAGDVSAKSTDAINGSQLYATNQAIAAAQTHYYSVNDTGTPVGNYNNDGATGRWSMAAGTAASAAGDQAVAVGNLANAASSRSIAIGSGASATNTNGDSIAIGGNASTTGYQTVGIGNDAVAATNNSVVVGPKASGSKETPSWPSAIPSTARVTTPSPSVAQPLRLPMVQSPSARGLLPTIMGRRSAPTPWQTATPPQSATTLPRTAA